MNEHSMEYVFERKQDGFASVRSKQKKKNIEWNF